MGKEKKQKLTLRETHEKLVRKEVSSGELTEAIFDTIDQKDKNLHCYLSTMRESALGDANTIDERISRGEKIGMLSGIPVAIKDNMLVEGVTCTAGSKILENYVASYDAAVVKKLKEQGAVIIGKTNLDEFAMGSSTENSAYGATKNPHDVERVPGGSSGGSAAAVAAGECVYALGSDTGGSIRQPASFCGVVGLKPTYGAVSRYGLIAMASSLDQIGPITNSVEDAEIVFEVISGRDPLDSTSVDYEFTHSNLKPKSPDKVEDSRRSRNYNLKTIKIGVPKEYFVEGLDEGVEKSVRKAISVLEQGGAKIEEISLPHTKYALSVYYLIMPSEVSANLARYDGIKYGLSEDKADNLLEVYLKTRQKGLGDEVRRRVVLGTYVLSAGYYDAYYLKAQRVRTLIKNDFEKAFERVDVIVTPTTPTTAFRLGEKTQDPLSMYLSDTFTVSAPIAGIPALSLPCGEVRGMPVGLQIMGKWFDEKTIFQVASFYENVKNND